MCPRPHRCNSFRSVFQQLRAGQCPYFYLCANNFTALFLSTGSGKDSKVVAFLTPTTSGLRQALTKEGMSCISFTRDLLPSLRTGIEFSFSVASNSNHTQQVPVAHGDSDEALEDESAANSWLNSMGLLTNSAPAKDPKTIILYPFQLLIVNQCWSGGGLKHFLYLFTLTPSKPAFSEK